MESVFPCEAEEEGGLESVFPCERLLSLPAPLAEDRFDDEDLGEGKKEEEEEVEEEGLGSVLKGSGLKKFGLGSGLISGRG